MTSDPIMVRARERGTMIEDKMKVRASIVDLLEDHGALDDGNDFDDALQGHSEYSIRRLAKICPENTANSLDDNIRYWRSRVTMYSPSQVPERLKVNGSEVNSSIWSVIRRPGQATAKLSLSVHK